MKTFSNTSSNDLGSVGFDAHAFSDIKEQDILDYFSRENFEDMFGADEGDDVDFASFVDAAISECRANGLLHQNNKQEQQ